MPSLTYQIKNMPYDRMKQYRFEQHDRDGNVLAPAEISTRSEKMYLDAAVKFGRWCKKTYGCKTPSECAEHIQDYADWLVAQRKAASTVHTYLAGVCRYWGVPLDTIDKPRRVIAENTHSRGSKPVDERADAKREASPRLYDFASIVGARRSELRALRGNDLVRDESGYYCVRISRGKGGKYQEQRILSEDVEFVKGYFDGTNEFVFTLNEMRNKIDLHHLRALNAQRTYRYYEQRIKDDAYQAQLIRELQARWNAHNNKRKWNENLVKGYYYLRGENRKLAQRLGLPTKYNRLAVLAVSVFSMSHWRCDVTVDNYLLAV